MCIRDSPEWSRAAANGRPAPFPVSGSGLGLGLSDGVLDVAQALLGVALDLPGLAVGLLLPVAGQLAHPFLDLALGLADGAFDVLIGHVGIPPIRRYGRAWLWARIPSRRIRAILGACRSRRSPRGR